MAARADLEHVLRRTEFVARPERLNELASMSIDQAVDNILDFGPNANPQFPGVILANRDANWQTFVDAWAWWMGNMVGLPRPMQEKMTLFWHGHFTSSLFSGIRSVGHIAQQNQLYRDLALGNLHTLTKRMAVEPAMLVYLNNDLNVNGSPNENFARELLELFTLGIGNYTEADVEAAARAWTGHGVGPFGDWTYSFVDDLHDSGMKTFFGISKNWDGPDIIDQVLRDDPTKRRIAARFITNKLWSFFAYPNGPAEVIDSLTDVFVSNGLELKPLLKALLTNPAFYSSTARQGLVRTPTDFLAAIVYHTGVDPVVTDGAWLGEFMGQRLFNPPNVAGWKANAYWLNTSAISGRALAARQVTWNLRSDSRFDYLNTLSVNDAIDATAAMFGITSMSATTRAGLAAAQDNERRARGADSWWAPTNLLTMTMLTPEFNMA